MMRNLKQQSGQVQAEYLTVVVAILIGFAAISLLYEDRRNWIAQLTHALQYRFLMESLFLKLPL